MSLYTFSYSFCLFLSLSVLFLFLDWQYRAGFWRPWPGGSGATVYGQSELAWNPFQLLHWAHGPQLQSMREAARAARRLQVLPSGVLAEVVQSQGLGGQEKMKFSDKISFKRLGNRCHASGFVLEYYMKINLTSRHPWNKKRSGSLISFWNWFLKLQHLTRNGTGTDWLNEKS